MSKVRLNLYSETEFDRKEIYRYLGAKEPDEELSRLVEECINECRGVSKFSVCFTESKINTDKDTVRFEAFEVESEALSKNLSDCEEVIIFAATAGIGIDRLISKYSVISPVKAVIIQAIGAERIESLCDKFNETMRKKYESDGFLLKPRFSPGYGDFSLEKQKDIFSVLDCEKKLGLSLNGNLLMSPSKSVTAIIGIYRK